jgi:hypothetical protein
MRIPLSALSLDEGLDALNGKNPSAAVWFSRPIKCQILARMRISYFLYFRSGKRDEIIKKFY